MLGTPQTPPIKMLAPCSHLISETFIADPSDRDHVRVTVSIGKTYKLLCQTNTSTQERILAIATIIEKALTAHRINCLYKENCPPPLFEITSLELKADEATLIKKLLHAQGVLSDFKENISHLRSIGFKVHGVAETFRVIDAQLEVDPETLASLLCVRTTQALFIIKEENHPLRRACDVEIRAQNPLSPNCEMR